MPKITITGQPPPSIFGNKDDWANAHTQDRDFNARASFQERQRRAKAQLEAQKYRETRAQAEYENSDFDLRQKMQERQRRMEEQQRKIEERQRERDRRNYERIEAQRARTTRAYADYENQAFDARARRGFRAASAMYPGQHKAFVGRYGSHEALGTLSGAYYNQEVRRLGNMGASSINRGELRELVRIDRTLVKMEKGLDKYTKANTLTSQEQEANRKKARDVLAASFTELSSAAEFAPGFKGMAARAIVARRAATARAAAGGGFGGYGGGGGAVGAGGAGGGRRGFLRRAASSVGGGMLDMIGGGLEGAAMVADPLLAGIGVAAAAYELPAGISALYGSAYRSALPYINLRRQAGELGINTGLNSAHLMKAFFAGKKKIGWEQSLGIGPEESMRILRNYGISPLSASQAAGDVQYIAGMRYKRGFAGLGDQTYEDLARTQSTFGLSRAKSLPEFQKILADAMAQGLDRAQILKTTNELLRQNAGAGAATVSVKSAASIQQRMINSGAPGGRSGALQLGFNANLNRTMANLGNNPVTAMPMYQALEHAGGGHTDASLKKFFGASQYAALEKTPEGRRLLEDIKTSPNAWAQLRFIGIALKGNKRRIMQLEKPYQYFSRTGNPALEDLGVQAGTGASLSEVVGWRSGKTAHAAKGFLSAIHYAQGKTGLDAAYLYGIGYVESRLGKHDYNAASGAASPWQVLPGGAGHKLHYLTKAQLLSDPKAAAVEAAKIFQSDWAHFKGMHLSREARFKAAAALYGGFAYRGESYKDVVAGHLKHGARAYVNSAWEHAQRYGFAPHSAVNQANARYKNPAAADVQMVSLTRSEQQAKAALKVLTSFSGSLIAVSNDMEKLSAQTANLVSNFTHLNKTISKKSLDIFGRYENHGMSMP